MLGIEIDGYSHDFIEVYEKDTIKTKKMKKLGIILLRFSDFQVKNKIENVMREIEQYIVDFEKHTPKSS